ncbi:MAG: 50S ribosomal protein L3 [Candidatus Omnitrophica bacterium]|nr:50S ribosomal protein L3 [Candidatus Omnitrophota bacterium]
MITGLIGKKLGMTQIFDKDGNQMSVSIIEAGPCTVLAVKDNPKKVQLGFEGIKESKVNKPTAGYYKKLGLSPKKYIREMDSTNNEGYQVGQEIKADFFKPGDFVDVSGVSIGKGFQGGMKRWGWSGGPASHGSMHHRRVGSIGASTFPGRTIKGWNMPGHMGSDNKTIQGLRVVGVDADQNLIMVRGAVPGAKNGLLTILRSRKKAFKSLDEKRAVVQHKVNPMKQSKKAAKAQVKPAGKK